MYNFKDDYYDILGVSPSATSSEIYENYIKLSKKNHPDLGGTNRIMQLINEAYQVIGDEAKRSLYDLWLSGVKAENTVYPKAYNHKNGILEVTTYASSFSIPLVCACCMKPYEKTIPLPFSSSSNKNTYVKNSLTVPLCQPCLNHLKKYRSSGILVAIGYSALVSFIQFVLVKAFILGSFLAALCSFFIMLIFTYVAYSTKRKPTIDKEHFSYGCPIDLTISSSNQKKFFFHNYTYGKMFLNNNPSAVLQKHIEELKKIKRYFKNIRFNFVIKKALPFTILFCFIVGISMKAESNITSENTPSPTTSASISMQLESPDSTPITVYEEWWEGTFDTTFGPLYLRKSSLSGDTFEGVYPDYGGILTGSLMDNKLTGTFQDDASCGSFTFTMEANSNKFTGSCKINDSANSSLWDGIKINNTVEVDQFVVRSPSPSPSPTETPYPYAPKERPETSLIHSYSTDSAIAPLTVKTTSDETDYFLKLINQSTDKVTYEFYIRGGETLTTKIALGVYKLRYASGSIWYGEEHFFGPDTSYLQGSDDLVFEKSGMMVYGYTITLYKVVGGNFDTKPINSEDF